MTKAQELGNERVSGWGDAITHTIKVDKKGRTIEEKYYRKVLTKREYFAGLAMQGLISRQDIEDPENTANNAVCYADALLEELSKTE